MIPKKSKFRNFGDYRMISLESDVSRVITTTILQGWVKGGGAGGRPEVGRLDSIKIWIGNGFSELLLPEKDS